MNIIDYIYICNCNCITYFFRCLKYNRLPNYLKIDSYDSDMEDNDSFKKEKEELVTAWVMIRD